MKKLIVILGIVIVVLVVLVVLPSDDNREQVNGEDVLENGANEITPVVEDVSIIATGLEIPWEIAWLPDGDILVTERPGRLTRIDESGDKTQIVVDGVRHIGEGGLMGMALHPEYAQNNFIYLYMTSPDEAGGTINRVVRYKFVENELINGTTIIEGIPGARFHDGGRIEFGPPQSCASRQSSEQADCMLYITTGDATSPDIAQDTNSLGGKLLRIRDDGSIPEDNPFGNAVYSYGHRNSQGIAWDDEGRLWSTEHGPSAPTPSPDCCRDEINLILPGANYGWPVVKGSETQEGMEDPVLQSGGTVTWAPASAEYYNGSIFFGGLVSETLYEAVLDGENVSELKEYFVNEFGRIRAVRVGPPMCGQSGQVDCMLYITTSNRDGRGSVQEGDDKLIRINPESLK